MRFIFSALLISVMISGCVSSQNLNLPQEKVHPFIGCWDSEDGLSREGWTVDPSGWLIGYSANRDNQNKVTFFEHMRVERKEHAPDVLVVSGADGATTRFERQDDKAGAYRFVNAEHDYPQRITYYTGEGRLDAEISLLDGSRAVQFRKAKCHTE